MGRNNESNLDIIKELCEELSLFFEAFTLDRVWNTDKSRLTVCFTAEKIKPRDMDLPRY